MARPSASPNPDLPIRVAERGEAGTPFRNWLFRRTQGDRRATERQLAFLQQWDHLRDDPEVAASAASYADRWAVSPATAYRLLEEFAALFPTEKNPGRLLELLWTGLSASHLGRTRVAALIDVPVVRKPAAGTRDLREILPQVTTGELGSPVYGPSGLLLPEGSSYEAYESSADRFGWAAMPERADSESPCHVSFILEGDADDVWMPAAGSAREHGDWDEAEMSSAAAWANQEGLRLQRVTVRVPQPVFRLAPRARPPRGDREVIKPPQKSRPCG